MADGVDAVESVRDEGRDLTELAAPELARFHDGDESIFRQLVEGLSPRLLAFVRPFAADEDHAHDLLQETWRRVFEKRRTFSAQGTLLGWIYAVCRNVCLGAQRRVSVRSESPPGFVGDEPTTVPHLDPQTAVEQMELRRALHEAVMALPARERDVIVLRMLQQLTTRETARALGCAEGTVKATLHHAIKKLQAAMEVWVDETLP